MALYDQGPAHQFSMAMLLPPTQKNEKKCILVLGTNETPKTLHIYKCIYLMPPKYKLTVTFSVIPYIYKIWQVANTTVRIHDQ